GVVPVALSLVTPGDGGDLLEEFLQSLGREIGFGELAEPEVVDPDPPQVPKGHLVGPFVDDIDTEVLEEGHDPRQGGLLTDPVQAETPGTCLGARGPVEGGGNGAGTFLCRG